VVPAAIAIAALMMVAANSVSIEYGEEDLSSKEALWTLYERWSAEYKEYRVKRRPDEKAWCFKIFNQNARSIHDFNKKGNTGCWSVIFMGLGLLIESTPLALIEDNPIFLGNGPLLPAPIRSARTNIH
jgi:hypothetical protein